MDTSSGSDSYDRTRRHRPRGREAHRRPGRDSGSGSGGGYRSDHLSEKINTLATTLQDTSKNLTKVDRMLGHYKEHTDDQAEAMALLRENLEESISQLQTQRQSRSNGARSASASTLHTSDLEAGSGSEGQRFYPTSPLRDYTGSAARKRRSHSAGVRFKDASLPDGDIHSLHQSLRDLRCDQQRLSVDLDREILRRNRSDIDNRRAMESLTGHITTSQRQDSVSSRVERRLQELEREMHGEERSLERERRPEQRGAVYDELQETTGRRQVQAREREEAVTARLLKAEKEKSKTEQDLVSARRLLEQSEDSRESLVQQVDDMHGELLRMKKEKSELQRARPESSQPNTQTHGIHTEVGRSGLRGPVSTDPSDLEKEVSELRVQLCKVSVLGEVEELKRALDRKEKERVRLSLQVEELSSELVRREQQQLRMLEQLREIQSRGQAERRDMEALLQESAKSRDELKTRAQVAVRQWRAKCKRTQKELEEAKAQAQLHADEALQAAREKESSQGRLKALSQQTEAARRELSEILGRLAQRDEELHRKDVELSESRQRQLSLEQEMREVREASAAVDEEARHQAATQARLREENLRLEERAETHSRRCQRDADAQAELRAALKQMTAERAQQAQRLAAEESSRKELQKSAAELQVKLTVMREEWAALGSQLQLEREVHRKELDNVRAMMDDDAVAKQRDLKADAASDKELCGVLRIKLDRMKDECDKLAAQLSTKDEAHALLHRKYQQIKGELDEKVRSREQRHALDLELEEKLLQMEAEQEAILTSMGQELDAACHGLSRNGEDKLQAISQKPGLVKDPHHWLAETKTKLRWLCEEVRERVARERRLRKQHLQTRDQLKALRRCRDSEHDALLQRLDQQEKLLRTLGAEKKELLERSRKKEEEMRSLQDRVLDVEMNTRIALDNLEAMPEKQCLMENFKDLEESQRQREMVEQRYAKYREIVWDLQRQLEESKRRIQENTDERLDATTRSLKLAALSSTIKGPSTFLSSSPMSDTPSPHKRLTSLDLEDSVLNGARRLEDQLDLE